jgi:murein DD-endopeptidase MepM/ murein hydrolase activator NlpD
MDEQRKWTRKVLGILRHDTTLVALSAAAIAVFTGVAAIVHQQNVDLRTPSIARAEAVLGDVAESTPDALQSLDLAYAAPPEPAFVPELATDTPSFEPALRVLEGVLERGETLTEALEEDGVSRGVVYGLTRAIGKLYDFRKARPGHSYRLELDAEGGLVEFRYRTSALDSYSVARDGEAFMSRREEPPTRTETARIAGVVSSNLHAAVVALGESPQLAVDLADIFAWDIDFSRSTRFGDEFRILYERVYRTDSQGREHYVGPGRILAARYLGASGDHAAIYFESAPGRAGYYRPDGSSVERNFLMAPVRYSRIASAFSNSRLHPILRVWRPHRGIDYAAPEGTPIWAVADGTVIHRGRAGGFGNLVKIRHADGYVSYYGHLSRFGGGLSVGSRVRQKQVIGYVGHTGLATGPHVCFRMSKHGRFVDPARLRMPGGGPPLSSELETVFAGSRDLLLARLDATAPLLETDEAL